MGKPASRRKSKSERRPNEHYPTQIGLVEAALALLPAPEPGAVVVDAGAGTGVWGQVAKRLWPWIHLIGVDIAFPPADGYDEWFQCDFITWAKQREPESVDCVIGNPPYGEWAEPFVWAARQLLQHGGIHLYLMALEFLGSQRRGRDLYQVYPPEHIIISMPRLDFIGGGGDMRNHALYWWRKGFVGKPDVDWFDFRSDYQQIPMEDLMTILNDSSPTFDQHCLVELFGHQQIVGRVTEQVIGGSAFIRVDVPQTSKRDSFTKFYGSGAIYAMTPVSEQMAQIMAERLGTEPVSEWSLRQALESMSKTNMLPSGIDDDDDEPLDDDETEPEPDPYADQPELAREQAIARAAGVPDSELPTRSENGVFVLDDLPDESDPGTSNRPSPASIEAGVERSSHDISADSAASEQTVEVASVTVAEPPAESSIETENCPEHERDIADPAIARKCARAWARKIISVPFVVIDLETTGTVAGDDEIVQIGIVDQDGQVLLDQLIKPTIHIPRAAARVNHITDQTVQDAPGFPDVHAALALHLNGKAVVSYNYDFDVPMLNGVCKKHGLPPLVPEVDDSRDGCAMLNFAAYYGDFNEYHGDWRWKKLGEAVSILGLTWDGSAHSAAADAKMTVQIIRKMAEAE